MFKFKTIVPWNMTQKELRQIVGSLYTAKNWKLTYATVLLDNGMEYKVNVADIDDYRNELITETGALCIS